MKDIFSSLEQHLSIRHITEIPAVASKQIHLLLPLKRNFNIKLCEQEAALNIAESYAMHGVNTIIHNYVSDVAEYMSEYNTCAGIINDNRMKKEPLDKQIVSFIDYLKSSEDERFILQAKNITKNIGIKRILLAYNTLPLKLLTFELSAEDIPKPHIKTAYS